MFTPEELTFNEDYGTASYDIDAAKKIIKDNWESIENQDFENFYKNHNMYIMVNMILLKARINPLDYMDYIPGQFFAFMNIRNYDIPNNIMVIGDCAFYDCKLLESVHIPKSVTYIGERAFHYCSSLKSIEIPKSCRYIDDNAFANCDSIQSVTIPSIFSKRYDLFDPELVNVKFI